MRSEFFPGLYARDPYVKRVKRLFERGFVFEIIEDLATVIVGSREDGSNILIEEVPIVSGYNPQIGDWVVIRYDAANANAPMISGPSISDDTETTPDTSSAEVIAARSSSRYGSHSTLDGRLEEHEADSTDPHGSSERITGNLKLGPISVCSYSEQLSIYSQPSSLSHLSGALIQVEPQRQGGSAIAEALSCVLRFNFDNQVDNNSCAMKLMLEFAGVSSFSSPLANHYSGLDLMVSFPLSFSGYVPEVHGLLLHPIFNLSATGLVGDMTMLRGSSVETLSPNISFFSWIDLPLPPTGPTSSVLFRSAGGEFHHAGNLFVGGENFNPIIQLNSERSWAFTYTNTGANTRLRLKTLTGAKHFTVTDAYDATCIDFYAVGNGTDSQITAPITTKWGFFGAVAVGQQTAPDSYGTSGTANDGIARAQINKIRTALINLGLCV